MLHEIKPSFENAFRKKEPEENDLALVYTEEGNLFVKEGETIRLPKIQELVMDKETVLRYGFAIGNISYYIVLESVALKEETEVIATKDLRILPLETIRFASLLGKQLWRFFNTRKYCGCCGSKTGLSDTEQAVICPQCSHVEYPKISPAVIVAIMNGDKLLMTKYAHGNYTKYALVAGFVEFGEDFEQAVAREVWEEVGLHVKNVTYYKNQPWPLTDSQMVGYFAELDGDDKVTLQEDELSEATWFSRDEIPVNPNSISVSYELIEAVRSGKAKEYIKEKASRR
ncbi:NAD(+) diphosphatase [[Clostridium] polysaccharolyticum]|uniref:NAD(+) diphosphatase n=1 Tax=[Clostridium] polysaccharolyticum TaxID=29364 RepID=A0A1H9Y4D9_9FIRM|nr:NAD(+) diphosphatase [[Clostridium] polysaccharolyticum]SES63626.1 NAD+ diphosphatase [[Clostridium] polysaccharolyticum]